MPVTLTRDYLSQLEITQEQYEDLMGSNPTVFSSCGTDCPVDSVSWYMAAAFANAVSSAAGLDECYSCSGSGATPTCTPSMDVYACEGYRLPTEAEWEGAARCGEDLLYAGSNTIVGRVAWYSGNSGGTPQSVGGLDPNGCGLFDMSGNIHEWVNDRADSGYYTTSGRTDLTGPTTGSAGTVEVVGANASTQRVAYRGGTTPTFRYAVRLWYSLGEDSGRRP